jgi:CRP/FNR family transcriptional regulator
MTRMRYLATRILTLTAYDAESRFFRFLEEHQGRKESYTLSLSKKDIAAAIGATPETLSRLILRLRNEGTIDWKGRTLRLPPGFWDDREEE